jgi:tetratricopeptide (TPR) repeat protein
MLGALACALTLGPALSLPVFADGLSGAYLAARQAGADNDFANSAEYLERALRADPENPALLENAILSYTALGQMDRAVAMAERLLALGLRSQSAHLVLLADQLVRGEFEAVREAIDSGREAGPLVDGLTGAWALIGEGRMSDALIAFDAMGANPSLAPFARFHKALALASVGDFESALEILSGEDAGPLQMTRRGVLAHVEILSQLERNDDALTLLGELFGADADPGIEDLRARLQAGEVLPYLAARNATEGLAEVFHTTASALVGEANDTVTLLYARLAEYLRADHEDAILLSARLLDELTQHVLAQQAFARIAPDSPRFYSAELGRADSLYRSGATEEAIATLQALAESHEGLITVHTALGDLLRREERFDAASQAYTRAIDLIGEPDERHWVVYYTRGICHEREDRWELADADFRRALDLRPDQPMVLNYLGYSLVERRENLEEALEMIETAVAGAPDNGHIIDSLGWALYRLGRHEEAVAPMERAAELLATDPIVNDHLGDVYWVVGRRLEAQFQWRRALSFDPEPEDETRIRRKLEVGLDRVLDEEATDERAAGN